MTLSKKSNKPHHPPVYMNETIIDEVESHKQLGLFFHEDENWHVHVDHIIDKVTPRLNVFRTLKFKLLRNHLQVIYFSFIRPLLEYADIIWDNIPEYLRDKLESMQIEAVRIVTRTTKLCSKQNLYKDTGWETLSERRKKHKILKFHEMFHKKGPKYLNQMVPQQIFEVHNYNTRRTNDTQNVNCRASYYKHSFLP
jgi:hypothetical protein